MSAVSAAYWGMTQAIARFERASDRVARVASDKDEVDPVEAVAETIEAEAAFEANVHSLRVQDETMGTLLDILA